MEGKLLQALLQDFVHAQPLIEAPAQALQPEALQYTLGSLQPGSRVKLWLASLSS